MHAREVKMVRPDAKGRITLGHLTDGISRFSVSVDKHNRIILQPYTEIPAAEKWLFENKLALNQVTKGLKDSAAGRTFSKGSFARFTDDSKK